MTKSENLEAVACAEIVRHAKVAITADGLKVSNPRLVLVKVVLALRASGYAVVEKEQWEHSKAARDFFASVIAIPKGELEL